MQVINRCIIKKLHFPIEGYRYNAQIITSVDGGQNFYYCGNGKYFRTEAEAEAYKAQIEGSTDNERTGASIS